MSNYLIVDERGIVQDEFDTETEALDECEWYNNDPALDAVSVYRVISSEEAAQQEGR